MRSSKRARSASDAQLARGLPRPHVQLLGVIEGQGADAAAVGRRMEAELPVVLGQHRLGTDRHVPPYVPSGAIGR